ncbi:MAG: ribonucleotide-diphosphate reductase subunit beta, partial [Candidatus Moraniibacteriota bacterium]
LPHFSDYVTSPEVNLILSIQTYQEAIHSQSYATILETVVDSKERDEIYYFWRTDKVLLERNRYIGQIYQDFIDTPTDQTFFRGIVANFLLESLYFYNGFAFFDTLVDHMKMLATGRMIAYIRRDELTHVTIFANLIREIRKEFPALYDEALLKEMMTEAVRQEIDWSKHILGNRIPGINGETTEGYTQWLANNRLAMLNIDPLYPEAVVNPYKHLDRLQDPNADKGNFFETTVVNYTQSTSMNGSWDF